MACCANMIIPPNEDYSEVFLVISGDPETGSEMDLTGYTAAMSFKLVPTTDADALFTLTVGDGLEINGEEVVYEGTTYSTGVIRMTVSRERAALLEGKKGYTDLLLKGSSVKQAAFKTWIGSKGVTNPSVLG